jgi:sugar/nucleoside kinase (ribokinase family)
MGLDVAGLGNALMDALVVIDDDRLITELGLQRGTMHPVDNARWQEVYERVKPLGVVFDSGGSCANTTATVGRLGGQAIYCGQVCDDELGRIYAERMLEACGNHALRFSGEQPTGKCLSIISRRDAERTMLTDLGAAVSMSVLGDFTQSIQQAKIAHFTGYTLLDGPMYSVAIEAMTAATAAGVTVSIDVADPFVVGLIRDRLWALLDEHADIVFLNADEARALTDLPPTEAVHAISERAGVGTTVVKIGKEGSLVRHGGEIYRIAIDPVQAIDTTGAGDAYAGGFLYGVSRGWPVERCAALASAVAAETVGQIGAVVKSRAVLQACLEKV